MKNSKIIEIPHYPTSRYDPILRKSVQNGTLSHALYEGETHYDTLDETGRPVYMKPIMLPNLPWDDELIYDSYYRGRSAAGSLFTNKQGQIFTVFMTDMDKFIPLMVNGVIKSKFIYCKRGKNYGVTLYE